MARPHHVLVAALLALVLLSRPGWSAGGADALDQLAARAEALEERRHGNEIPETEIRDLESRFISLMRQTPEDRAVATQLASFYDDLTWSLRTPAPELLDLVRTSQDPAELARIFIDAGSSVLQAQIALAALESRPADPVLWDWAAKAVPDEAWRILFQEEAFRVRLAAPSASSDTPSAPALAARWLSHLLTSGFLHRALVAYRELAPEIRASIDDDSAVPDGRFDGYGGDRRDLRLELAAAAFLDGDRETAGRLLRAATQKPAVRRPPQKHELDALLLLQRLVERALAAPSDDGFDLLTGHLTDIMGDWVLIRSLLTARLAVREAYPALAAYELKRTASFLQDGNDFFEPDANVPVRLQAAKEGIDAERESLARSLEDEARAAETAARNGLGSDPAAPIIARLLTTPAAPVFAERPLPRGLKPVRLSDEKIEARLTAAAQRVHLPSGLSAVRIDQKGQQVAAIVTSQALDPVGEISDGGYWVLLSKDGGATWGDPLYTGLRLNQPYVVRPVSSFSLFAGDHLRLEVEVLELDSSLLFFPPVSLPVKRSAEGLFLEIPLSTLTRDSDGDGLTDLTEARLLTDPSLADSDGDRLTDGDDPLPCVPQSADTSITTEALAAVVQEIAGVGKRALIEGVVGTPIGVACCGSQKGPPFIEPTVFFIGERPLFAGLRPDRRVVILTHGEAEAAANIFGPFFPLTLKLFLFDHTGHHAFVVWSASWQGGVLRLEEKNGQWIVNKLLSWIT